MTLNKNKTAITLVVITLILGVIGYVGNTFLQNISISQSTIQTQIDKKMPLTIQKLGASIVIAHATTTITDTVNINLNGTSMFMGHNTPFTAHIQSHINYRDGKFYLDPKELDLKLAESKDDFVAHPITNKLLHIGLAKAKSLGFNDADLHNIVLNTVKDKISTIPVYQLKAGVVRASLKDVQFKDGFVHVNISLLEFAKTGLAIIITMVLALGFAIAIASGGFTGTGWLLLVP